MGKTTIAFLRKSIAFKRSLLRAMGDEERRQTQVEIESMELAIRKILQGDLSAGGEYA